MASSGWVKFTIRPSQSAGGSEGTAAVAGRGTFQRFGKWHPTPEWLQWAAENIDINAVHREAKKKQLNPEYVIPKEAVMRQVNPE